jgi:hypothetical protein
MAHHSHATQSFGLTFLLLMKSFLFFFIVSFLFFFESSLYAEGSAHPMAEKARQDLLLPGTSLAEGVSEITGVAVSPLLGVSAIGAWKYFHTNENLRSKLPWYCHPYIWGSGLALLTLCFLKDFLGAAAPALVKKPLDFLELFEDKLSALVASAGFVPLVALAVSQYQQIRPEQSSANFAGSGLALMPLSDLAQCSMYNPWVTIPVSIAAFCIVWLSAHALNVLIALSPFGIVDAGLKLAKLALISAITLSAALNPYFGAVVSLAFILIGALAAGWSFRLTVFGALMGRDFLLNKHASAEEVRESGVKGFLARRFDGVPVRTFGKLKRSPEECLSFVYRPWLLLPQRSVPFAEDGMVVCKGLLHPTVSHRETLASAPRSSLLLLPRYRRIEETIATRYGCQEVIDSALMRGFKAMRQWLIDILSVGKKVIESRAN